MPVEKKVLVLVGPSGSGKSTVSDLLAEKGIPKLVTTTTRKPRPGEENGVHYHFRTIEQMQEEAFIEQTFYAENVYGLSVKEINEKLSKYDLVQVTMDKNGAKAMEEQFPNETRIIYFEITEAEMVNRMKKRGDSLEMIDERIAHSHMTKELELLENADLMVSEGTPEEIAQKIMNQFT